MDKILASILQLSAPAVAALVSSLLSALAVWLVGKLQANARTANLALVVETAADAVAAAVKAAGSDAGKNPKQLIADAVAAAKARVLFQVPEIEKSLEAELDVLIHGVVAQAVVTPGGAVANLPAPGGGNRGVVPLVVVAVVAVVIAVGGAVALVFAEPNGLAQVEGCVADDLQGDPAAVTTIGQTLGQANHGPAEQAIISLAGPLAKCIAVDFYNDVAGRKVAALQSQGATIPHPELVQIHARDYLGSVGVKLPPPTINRLAGTSSGGSGGTSGN